MSGVRDTAVFNRTDRAVEGWYWAIRSDQVPAGAVRKVRLVGRDLVVWRASDGTVSAFDAYCPHMGAHLGEGRVDGDTLRCFFHAWQLDKRGVVTSIPCQDHPVSASVATWPTAEAYGLVWIWTGSTPRHPVPFIPALRDRPIRSRLGGAFVKGCHPNVVMVNAIDEQHFASVHNLFVDLHFDVQPVNENAATWDNTTRVPDTSWFTRFIGRFYEGALTYRMTYWNGTTGSVTVGPDFWHFHIVFALRPNDAGQTEGQTILVSPAVPTLAGRVWNEIALSASKVVGDYFAKGDTEVFQSIKWDFKHPLRADRSIVSFIQHLDGQPAVRWGTWEPIGAAS